MNGKRGKSSKQIWRSTTTSTTTYIHARSRSPGRVLRGRCDGDSTQNAPDGPRSPARGSPGASTTRHRCTQPLLGGPDRPRTILTNTTPARQYTANETGACLGWIVDWRNARPCLVGVAVGNLVRAREGRRASNETGSTKQGCSMALGLRMQARCALMQAAACGPNRPTQIYKPATRETQATAISLCQTLPWASYEPARYSSSHHSHLASSTCDDPYILQHAAHTMTCHSALSLTHIHTRENLSSRRRKSRADTWEPNMPA